MAKLNAHQVLVRHGNRQFLYLLQYRGGLWATNGFAAFYVGKDEVAEDQKKLRDNLDLYDTSKQDALGQVFRSWDMLDTSRPLTPSGWFLTQPVGPPDLLYALLVDMSVPDWPPDWVFINRDYLLFAREIGVVKWQGAMEETHRSPVVGVNDYGGWLSIVYPVDSESLRAGTARAQLHRMLAVSAK